MVTDEQIKEAIRVIKSLSDKCRELLTENERLRDSNSFLRAAYINAMNRVDELEKDLQ